MEYSISISFFHIKIFKKKVQPKYNKVHVYTSSDTSWLHTKCILVLNILHDKTIFSFIHGVYENNI